MAKEKARRAPARWAQAKQTAACLLEYGPGTTGCPAVEQAIEGLYAGQSEENFWTLMSALHYALEMETEVLVPVDATQGAPAAAAPWAANPIRGEKAGNIRFWTLRNEDRKKTWLPVFFSSADVLRDRSTANRPVVQKSLRSMMELVLASKEIDGIVVNPWSRSALLEHALLNGILHAQPVDTEGGGEEELDAGLAAERGGDLEEAFRQYQASARLGCPEGQRMLGRCYDQGRGTEPDLRSALYWLEAAAGEADVLAMLWLGDIYAAGRDSGRPDPGRALLAYRRAYKRAAEQPDLDYWPEVCLRLAQHEVRHTSPEEALRLAAEARHGLRLRLAKGDPFARAELDRAETLCRELTAPPERLDGPLAAYSTEPSQKD